MQCTHCSVFSSHRLMVPFLYILINTVFSLHGQPSSILQHTHKAVIAGPCKYSIPMFMSQKNRYVTPVKLCYQCSVLYKRQKSEKTQSRNCVMRVKAIDTTAQSLTTSVMGQSGGGDSPSEPPRRNNPWCLISSPSASRISRKILSEVTVFIFLRTTKNPASLLTHTVPRTTSSQTVFTPGVIRFLHHPPE